MTKKVIEHICFPLGETPTLEDIEDCISISQQKNCIVKLTWCVKYNGEYFRYIAPDTNVEELFDKLPKIYGL